MAFQKYATFPQFRRGATSGLQRTCFHGNILFKMGDSPLLCFISGKWAVSLGHTVFGQKRG
jgi:hypothetical protein